MAEEILDISDDDSEDTIFIEADEESGKSAKAVKNKEFIERARLRVDSRKWLLSKLLPKTYGDRTILAGDPENPLAGMTDEQLMAKLEHLRKNDPR